MFNRKFIIFCLLVLLMPLLTILLPLPVKAAPPAITITPVEAAVNTNTDFCFGWSSQDLTSSDNLIVGFYSDQVDANKRFDLSGLTNSELTFYIDSDDCGNTQGAGYEARVSESVFGPDNNGHDVGVVTNSGDYVIGVLNLDTDVVIADATPISIGFANVEGDSVKTPIDPGNYKVEIIQYVDGSDPAVVDWSEIQLLYIGEMNKVDITATLDPSISLALDQNTCQMSILTADVIQTCGYTATVTTNIGSGYTGYVEQNHPFQTTSNGVTNVILGPDTDNIINAVGDGTLSNDSGEYGFSVQTNDSTTLPEFTGSCLDYDESGTNAGLVSLPATSLAADDTRYAFASYTAATNGVDHGVTSFCNGVRIKYSTVPGNYDQTLTITVVGNF